jgi:preprotein translocase subunit SecG
MTFLAAVDLKHYFFMIPLMLLSVFLILVILVQRGRGGGLTGALGGMGGQSAFGTKAGDLFTRITIVVAAIWVLLSMASLKVLNQYSGTANLNRDQHGQVIPATKTGEGGLLPSATMPGEAATGKTPEAVPADEKARAAPAAEAPAVTTPAAAPAATKSDAAGPPAEPAKAADAAKP